jgi:hypothetical protein
MSPSSQTQVGWYVKGAVCMPKTIPDKGQDVNICWCLHLLKIDRSLLHLTKKAQEVARFLLKKIIPQFEIPVSIGSNNGPAFLTEMVQLDTSG